MPGVNTTSPAGIEFIERHEGVVLRAYLDPVGVWTIGAGLTAASGVVVPRAGMVITKAEASRLMRLALARNYEPAVATAMPGAAAHEFDAGVSFHYNTGAIGRASWVQRWHLRDWPGTRAALALWNKAGERVLEGLVRRREAEFLLLKDGVYGAAQVPPVSVGTLLARFAPPLSGPERESIRQDMIVLGFAAGPAAEQVRRDAVLQFQTEHGLTVDGIVGPATRATIARMLEGRSKGGIALGAFTLSGIAAVAGDALTAGGPIWMLAIIPGVIFLLWTGWRRRDWIAAAVSTRIPALAAFLRRF